MFSTQSGNCIPIFPCLYLPLNWKSLKLAYQLKDQNCKPIKWAALTLSSIKTHFNTLKKKLKKEIVEKGEIAHFEQFHVFPAMFSMQSVS